MSWADYGFPDPTMMPCYLPAKALQLAYAERETIRAGQDSLIAEDYTPSPFIEETGFHFSQGSDGMFGGHGWTIPAVDRYVNHLLDLDQPISRLFFIDSDMEDIINAADTTGLGYLEANNVTGRIRPTMLPEWPKAWLCQRYLALNLLKIVEVPFIVTMRSGSTGDAWIESLTTPQMAFDYAVEHSSVIVVSSILSIADLSMWTIINESPGGGVYGCDFRRVEKIDVDYAQVPHLAGLPTYIYVMTAAGTAYDQGYTFDNHGFPIRDGAGIATRIPLPWESDGVAIPNGGLAVGSFGYTIRLDSAVDRLFRWQYAGVDVSSKFAFYDDVDAIAAGAA